MNENVREVATQILVKAHDLINGPGKWIQLAAARRADYHVTDSTSPEAVCWCATGAITRAAEDRFRDEAGLRPVKDHFMVTADGYSLARDTMSSYLRDFYGNANIIEWNDEEDRTQSEVLSAFRGAIRRLDRIED